MKIENIPAEIKSKSLKEAKDEINEILLQLESKNLDLSDSEDKYKRLIIFIQLKFTFNHLGTFRISSYLV